MTGCKSCFAESRVMTCSCFLEVQAFLLLMHCVRIGFLASRWESSHLITWNGWSMRWQMHFENKLLVISIAPVSNSSSFGKDTFFKLALRQAFAERDENRFDLQSLHVLTVPQPVSPKHLITTLLDWTPGRFNAEAFLWAPWEATNQEIWGRVHCGALDTFAFKLFQVSSSQVLYAYYPTFIHVGLPEFVAFRKTSLTKIVQRLLLLRQTLAVNLRMTILCKCLKWKKQMKQK